MRRIAPLITIVCCFIVLVPLATISLIGNRAPVNVFMPNGGNVAVRGVSDIFIQGWGFFTRDPTEMRTVLYLKSKGDSAWYEDSLNAPNPLEMAFGLSRERRAYLADLGNILDRIEEQKIEYISCGPLDSDYIGDCVENEGSHNVSFESPPYQAGWCGEEVIIAQFQPIPFGYAQHTDQQKAHALKVNIQCNHQD